MRRFRGPELATPAFFDDQIARLATHALKSAVVELMRVAPRTVGGITARVVAHSRAGVDPFDGLVRVGIDEISYRRGHKYLKMVVVDHDTGGWCGSPKAMIKRLSG